MAEINRFLGSHRNPRPQDFSRERSPRRTSDTRPDNSDRVKQANGGKGAKGGKGGKGGKGQEKKQNNSEYFSETPKSFEAAWFSNFFSPSLLLLFTTLGFVVTRIPVLNNLPIGGRLSSCLDAWKKVTNNSWVCNVIENGYKIPFSSKPRQKIPPKNPPVSGPALQVLLDEAEALKSKAAIAAVDAVPGQYISSYFSVPKLRSPGKFRPILNLKYFNLNIKKYKFRMEGISQVRQWIKENAWFCSIDLKDQFLHCPINSEFRKFLRFSWLGQILEWQVLPFGLRCSPRVVTKILKPCMAFLRSVFGILITIYIDDMLLQSSSPETVLRHSQITALLLMLLGWSLNWEKSNFVPSQEVIHLGFIFNSKKMTISCPPPKIERLQEFSRTLLKAKVSSVHDLERLIGTMESVRPSTPLAALKYRNLQKQLLKSKCPDRQPKQLVHLTQKSMAELVWWSCQSGFSG